jgi:hypothetical protein
VQTGLPIAPRDGRSIRVSAFANTFRVTQWDQIARDNKQTHEHLSVAP